MLKGGESMKYQKTLLVQLARRIEKKLKRKEKIKRIWHNL